MSFDVEREAKEFANAHGLSVHTHEVYLTPLLTRCQDAAELECIRLTCTKCRADAPLNRREFSWGPHWFHEGNPCCAELIHERRRKREEQG